MLAESGHRDDALRPVLLPRARARCERNYDFITCSETAEHFHHPTDEFDRLDRLLRPGGWLALMTCFQTDDDRFADWHYRKDPTHVVFYREVTMRTIAGMRGWTCEIPTKGVALMRKAGGCAMTWMHEQRLDAVHWRAAGSVGAETVLDLGCGDGALAR
jgi:cyclopropane fatty-acyl-phospholipid synthase-like methyltransferase